MGKQPTVKEVYEIIMKALDYEPQDSWDNSGLQIGAWDNHVTNIVVALDLTPDVIKKAIDCDANLIVTHHPLIFKGVKSIDTNDNKGKLIYQAIKIGFNVISIHTPIDKALLSKTFAKYMQLKVSDHYSCEDIIPLSQSGYGSVFKYNKNTRVSNFVKTVASVLGCDIEFAHTNAVDDIMLENPTIAFCGGAGGEFIPDAINAGADIYITGDIRYHDFVDYAGKIILIDMGHSQTETFITGVFKSIISDGLRNQFEFYPDIQEYTKHTVKSILDI